MNWTDMVSTDCLALAGSPYQWAIAGIIAVAIFAPRLLPPLARILGAEARRRIGLPPQASVRPKQQERPTIVEIIPPRHTIEVHDVVSEPISTEAQKSNRRYLIAGLSVAFVLVVMLWYLLHSR